MIENIGIVGAGNVASFHIEALIAVGFELNGICATPGSHRAKSLATKYSIPYFHTVSKLIHESNSQSYLICVEASAINSVLDEFSSLNLPLLIEKPGPSRIHGAMRDPFEDKLSWFVAYNRRFYEPIETLKKNFDSNGGFITFRFIESCLISDLMSVQEALFNNTVHGIDLIHFLIGDFSFAEYYLSIEGSFFEAKIISELRGYVGKLVIFFGAPANTSIELIRGGEIYLVQPLEKITKFNSIEILEPSEDNQIRTYKPIWIGDSAQIETCNLHFKPGFLKQASEFKHNQPGVDSRLCSVTENYRTLKTIDKIVDFMKSTI